MFLVHNFNPALLAVHYYSGNSFFDIVHFLWYHFRGTHTEDVKVVPVTFFQNLQESLCKNLFFIKLTKWLGKHLRRAFMSKVWGCNFAIKGLVNFEDCLRFLLEDLRANSSVRFRSIWDFTAVFKTVTVFRQLHYESFSSATQRKQCLTF